MGHLESATRSIRRKHRGLQSHLDKSAGAGVALGQQGCYADVWNNIEYAAGADNPPKLRDRILGPSLGLVQIPRNIHCADVTSTSLVLGHGHIQ